MNGIPVDRRVKPDDDKKIRENEESARTVFVDSRFRGNDESGNPDMTRTKGPKARFEPTEADRQAVEAMAADGLSQAVICKSIVNPATGRPINGQTLRFRFSREINVGRSKMLWRKNELARQRRYRTDKKARAPSAAGEQNSPRPSPNERVTYESDHGKVVIYIPDDGSDPPAEGAPGKVSGEPG